MSTNFTNATALVNDTFSLSGDSFPQKIAKTAAYCLVFLVSLTGNALIIWAIYRDKRLRTNTNILVANMAVSDLVYSLFAIPQRFLDINLSGYGRWLIDGDIGLAVCKILPFLQTICLAVSFYSCIFIAVDRYYAVAHPFRGGFSRSRLKYIIPGIWICASVMFSPHIYSRRLSNRGGVPYCSDDWSQAGVANGLALRIQYLLLLTLFIGIPIPVIAVIYILIVYKLYKNKAPGQSVSSARLRRERQNKKILKMASAIVGIFFLGWSMYSVLSFLTALGKRPRFATYNQLFFAAVFIAQSNCIYNFFICLFFMPVYRKNFKCIVSKCFSCAACSKRLRNGSNSRSYSDGIFRSGTDNRSFVIESNETIQITAFRSTSRT